MPWGLVVPVKPLSTAKTRLEASVGVDRQELALAFARDTVATALLTPGVDVVIIVTSDRRVAAAFESVPVPVHGEPRTSGLNPALAHGALILRGHNPSLHVAALCSDLPAIRPAELGLALVQAADYDRAFVVDATGAGTTLLTARPGIALDPRFGVASAAAHQLSGATALEGSLSSLRQDVDDAADLATALELGVGAWTSAALSID